MSDVLVVGGGIVGLLSAMELTTRQRSVTIIDFPVVSPSASWAGGGILAPLYPWRYSDAMTRLTIDSLSRFDSILEAIDPGGALGRRLMNRCGLWVEVAESEKPYAISWASHWGLPVKVCSATDLMHEAAPGDGLFFPSLGNIRNSGLLKALREYLIGLGVRFETARVDKIKSHSSGPVSVCASDGRSWTAEQVLVSAGAGGQALLGSMGLHLPLFPAKGEMLLYQMEPGDVPSVMLTERGYLIPRNDGAVLVGSTLRKGDNTTYPTVAGRYQLESLAEYLWPVLKSRKPMHHWAGVRPGCARDFPYIGRVPGQPGVFTLAGHFRNGLVSGPASAELVVQLMCQETPFTDPDAYSLLSSSLSSSSFFSR
ncbi:FAD-dependent oxidoreductase [uncultured Alcanivorax sp.]|jgi:glycine oxidase|uniref:NAD(P)/FAD-dependent oxidoreductase n=1 Tax=uncultured Alcanivorax sp. TaxID=191215 RepID=UPI00261F621E|nr:FAD-dependent oxidoreductase [uncultured Alcanivorax sp.]